MSPPVFSILVTAYKEPETVSRALVALISQTNSAEIIVICPDDATANVAQGHGVTVLRDAGRGKPAALNQGLAHASGEIVIMTDGDVYIGEGAIDSLVSPFADPAVGAVSGRPVSLNPRDTMLGYWSHLLTDAGAHAERQRRHAAGQFFMCSGYLYAIRACLIDHIPEYALAEDAVVSHVIGQQGYDIRYAPEAEVYVKYPATYRDWLKQKIRSAGGYAQPVIARSPLRMRSLRGEIAAGTMRALRYAENAREFFWTLVLFAARLHMWLLIFWRVRVKQQPLTSLWKRVESTK